MAKNLDISLLLDFYGDMLTEKQRDVVELYYNEDLSLAEIAAHSQITRQGVRDSIKRAEGVLLGLEERLGLVKKFRRIQDGLDLIVRDARYISDYNSRFGAFQEVSERINEIIRIANSINE
ncbi:sigma factor-like helix-turn-helix DNA-binding protein [Oscillospiraceae bacterium PP1C4]